MVALLLALSRVQSSRNLRSPYVTQHIGSGGRARSSTFDAPSSRQLTAAAAVHGKTFNRLLVDSGISISAPDVVEAAAISGPVALRDEPTSFGLDPDAVVARRRADQRMAASDGLRFAIKGSSSGSAIVEHDAAAACMQRSTS